MKKPIRSFVLLLLLYVSSFAAYALEDQPYPDVKEGVVTLQIDNPSHKAGYTIGDILSRHMVITIKKPYKLIPESLPIVGYEKKYKGQPLGIDLSALKHSEIESSDATEHELTLSYQVFTNSVVAKPAALPTEYLRLINAESKNKEIVKFRIPSWEFVISPLSIFGQVKVEEDMSGFRGPLLLDNNSEKQRLKVLLSLLALSLLGLVYILGQHAWLPKMGGPFAQAYRAIRKLPNTDEGLQAAVTIVHESLDKTAGHSLFTTNLASFLDKKPSFKAVETELEQFYALSRHVFFEPHSKQEVSKEPIQWLLKFCRRCRDCERGLRPDPNTANNKG